MAWWIWVLVGLGLLAAELVTPGGFFAVFFGMAGLIVGMLAGLGVVRSDAMQWLLFSLLSVLGVALFRKPIMKAMKLDQGKKVVDGLAGEDAVVTEDVLAGGVGKAELRGSTWSARSTSPVPLVRGQRCKVERVEGLTLWIRA